MVVGEAVIDLRVRHVIRVAGRPLSVERRGIRIGGRQRHDVDGVDSVVFESGEEMRLVLPDRAAEGAAVASLAVRRVRAGREDVPRVEVLVAAEEETGTAVQIRSRLRHDVHHSAQRRSVLSVELVAHHLEFLHRILGHVDRRAPPDRVVHVAAVDDGREAVALIRDAAEFRDRELVPAVRRGSRQQLREHEKVS